MTSKHVIAIGIVGFLAGIALQATFGGSWFVMSVLSVVLMITEIDSGA